MKLATLADVCDLMRRLPDGHRERSTWRHVAAEFERVAAGASALDLSIAVRMAQSPAGVPWRLE
jgi:hypothetical protein